VGKPEQAGTSRALPFTGTDQIGLYRVRGAGADGTFARQAAQDFAVNLDPRESDPARLAPEKRPDRIALKTGGAKPPKHRVELWHTLSAALILLLLVESVLALRWRRSAAVEEQSAVQAK
jgi:hypothetical protein